MSEKYKTLKVKELQELLQKNNLSTTGKKEDLIARLVKDDERKALESLEKEFELDGDFDESKINLDIPTDDIFALEKLPLIEKESVLSDDDDDVDLIFNDKKTIKPKATSVPSTSTSTAASPATSTASVAAKTTESIVKQTETPKQKTPTSGAISNTNNITTTTTTTTTTTVKATVSSSFKFTPITFDKKPATASTPVAATSNTAMTAAPGVKAPPKSKIKPAAAKPTPVPTKKLDDEAEKLRLEAERRLERSKRFGVKLDEKEMKEIRAARFGIQPATETAPTTANTKASKANTPAIPKAKEKHANNKKDDGSKKKTPADPQQEILKKRAERFGLPEKKVEETKTPAKKANNKNKKKASVATPKESPVKKVQNGRITKVKPATPVAANKNSNKKNITVNVTKNNVLNKKQKNVNKLNKEGIITQNKKNIINQRKVNIANNNNNNNNNNSDAAPIVNNGRVITIAPKSNTKTAPPTNTLKRKRNESNAAPANNGRSVVINPNQRKVTIAPAPPAATAPAPKPTQNGRSRNSNNSATRKRGPGSRQRNKNNSNQPMPIPAISPPQNQRRNKRGRQN
ncbi:unnamed protein product [Mucor circinelloides]